MKNSWKTTMFAALTAAAGFVLVSPELFAEYKIVISLAKFIAAGGMVGFGFAARDNQVSDEQAGAGVEPPNKQERYD